MSANDRQVGGKHYASEYQHWDFVEDINLPYLEGCITKYIARWPKKRGPDDLEDLKKSAHYLDKLIELQARRPPRPPVSYGPGRADAIKRFITFNELGAAQAMVVTLVCTWVTVHSLEMAKATILSLIEEESAKSSERKAAQNG